MAAINVILIALGLSMDAFAVSVGAGLALRRNCFPHALRRGLVFGAFQAGMPVAGWLGGISFRRVMAPLDHWIAFVLLGVIGAHMILEAGQPRPQHRPARKMAELLLLGVATSIDALAVGLTFAFLGVSIWTPILVIGAVTFIMSFAGVYLGRRVGRMFARRVESLGGILLIVMGVVILVRHLSAGT